MRIILGLLILVIPVLGLVMIFIACRSVGIKEFGLKNVFKSVLMTCISTALAWLLLTASVFWNPIVYEQISGLDSTGLQLISIPLYFIAVAGTIFDPLKAWKKANSSREENGTDSNFLPVTSG